MQYVLTSSMVFTKIQQNNIPLRQLQLPPETREAIMIKLGSQKHSTNKARFVYSEQMLYLTMIASLADYRQLHSDPVTQGCYQQMKQGDIAKIYTTLDEVGYQKYEVMHFYLKTKKKSKILMRYEPIPSLKGQQTPALFKNYKSVQDYKSNKNQQTVLVVLSSDPIATILQTRVQLPQLHLTIEILSNMDGTAITSKVPLQMHPN